jgi:transcriptional regulator with XRE-family HTH domain
MLIRIDSPKELGLVLRATRKAGGSRIDDFAAMTRVSKEFATDLEHGKESVHLGLAMKIMKELGVHLVVDMPNDAAVRYEELQRTPLKPRTKANRSLSTPPANSL